MGNPWENATHYCDGPYRIIHLFPTKVACGQIVGQIIFIYTTFSRYDRFKPNFSELPFVQILDTLMLDEGDH